MGVAGTEAHRLLDVGLGILGLAEVTLAVADLCVCAGQIAIEVQRPLALPDALGGAVGMHLDHAQNQMGPRIVGSKRQRLGYGRFSGGKPRGSIIREERYRDCRIHVGNADQPPYVDPAPRRAHTGGGPLRGCQA